MVFDCVRKLTHQVQMKQPVPEMLLQLSLSGTGALAQHNSALIV